MASRALSSNEELWQRASRTGTGLSVTTLRFARTISLHQVDASAALAASKHPILAAKILKVQKPKAHWEIRVQDGSAPHVRVVERKWADVLGDGADTLGASESEEALRLLTQAEMNLPLALADKDDEEATDVFQVHVYPSELATCVVLRGHCAAFDRSSALFVARGFLSSLAAVLAGSAPPSPHWPSSGVSLPPPLASLMPRGAQSKGLFSKVVDTVGYAVNSKSAMLPFQPGCADSRKSRFQSEVISIQLSKEETDSLKAACEARGSSLYGIECAAVLKAAAEELHLKKEESFGVTSLIDCRQHCDPPLSPSAIGVFDSGLPLKHSCSQASSLWGIAGQLTQQVAAAVSKGKHFSELPVLEMLFGTVLNNPPLSPEHSLRTSFLTAFTDGPLPLDLTGHEGSALNGSTSNGSSNGSSAGDSADLAPLQLDGVMGPLVASHGIGPCIGMPDFIKNGALEVLLVYPNPLYSPAKMAEFAVLVKSNLLAAAANQDV
ncbi:hypothetical protein CLOP_g7373 [Closterium sp. NIES-67]|nr:hypothetical protein CLOP_g7373 [Closterium sp. NIES-67]